MMGLLRSFVAGIALLASAGVGYAQSIVVLVNDEPITSFDVSNRQRFLALTSGFGDRMRATLQSEDTKERFREFMTKERPTSQEEARELQKKFVDSLQQEVLNSASGSLRKQAIDQLIEERLMLQAARDQKISVTDDDVNQSMSRMAEGGQKKLSLNEFLSQFTSQGINPATLRERIRAQTAWRQVIRRVYGSRVQAAVSAVETVAANDSAANTVLDVRVVSLPVAAKTDQAALAKRLTEAEQIRQRFTSCDTLDAMLKGVQGATVKTLKATKLDDFRGEVKVALEKAQPGQMTPPIVAGAAVEAHALCSKKQTVAAGKSTEKKAEPVDRSQEEFQLYSKRHLKDLKDQARLDYRKNG